VPRKPETKPRWGYRPTKSRSELFDCDSEWNREDKLKHINECMQRLKNLPVELDIKFNPAQQQRYENIIDSWIGSCLQFDDQPRKRHIKAALEKIVKYAGAMHKSNKNPSKQIQQFTQSIDQLDHSTVRYLMRQDISLDYNTRTQARSFRGSNITTDMHTIADRFKVAAEAVLATIGVDGGGPNRDHPLAHLVLNLGPLVKEATGRMGRTFDDIKGIHSGPLVELIHAIYSQTTIAKRKSYISSTISNFRHLLK